MTEYLQTTVDKFTFKVATDRLYSAEGVWAKVEGEGVRLGLSDFVQQRSGDAAFVEVKAAGTEVAAGDEIASLETIKVNISLASPLTGKVVEGNPALLESPEAVNQDPFGDGWLAVVQAADWEAEKTRLLDPQAYFTRMKREAEQEVGQG
jgi:glycine cleavage system H protein